MSHDKDLKIQGTSVEVTRNGQAGFCLERWEFLDFQMLCIGCIGMFRLFRYIWYFCARSDGKT